MANARTLLARNMKQFRKILGISQMMLAARVGCSVTLIGNIEIKKRFPSAENIDRIAQALGVQVADLFTENIDAGKQLKTKQEIKSKLQSNILAAIDNALEQEQRIV